MQNRTDLALELKEEKNIGSAQSGIIVKTRIDTTNHIKETKIIIKNKKGEDSLGKPKGTYITIEAKDLSTNDGSFHKEMSEALFLNLKEMLNKKKKILIAGLGNADVTADSLGPKVVNNLYITRHLQKEGIGNYQFDKSFTGKTLRNKNASGNNQILQIPFQQGDTENLKKATIHIDIIHIRQQLLFIINIILSLRKNTTCILHLLRHTFGYANTGSYKQMH